MRKRKPIPDAMINAIAQRFRIMGEPSRLRILEELLNGDRSVGALVSALALSQSNTSRHLQALFDAGLVARRREASEVIYCIGDPIVEQLCQIMCASELNRVETTLKQLKRS